MSRMPFYAHTKRDSGPEGWQELRGHLQEVATISSRLAAKVGLSQAGKLIGIAHDLGKYSKAFQQYLQEAAGNAAMEMEQNFRLKGSVDHSTAGAQTIWRGLDRKSTRLNSSHLGISYAV